MNLRLDWCSYESAKYAVEHWHYSKRMPTSKLVRIGVWEENQFIGCVLFGVGANNHLVQCYGLRPQQGCELVRIALKHNHQTPVSRVTAIALKMLKGLCPGIRLVVSFADPRENHHGGIYQAGGWIYTGQSAPERFPIIGNEVRHPRILGEMIKRGFTNIRKQVEYKKIPGKFRYLMPMDSGMRKQILPLSKPYPKRATSITGDAPAIQVGQGGSIPTVALNTVCLMSL